MLKKKNIAMVMAATTVATSVAPVFAAEVKADEEIIKRVEDVKTTLKKNEEQTKQLINDLRSLLNDGTKYDTVSNENGTYGIYVDELGTNVNIGNRKSDNAEGRTRSVRFRDRKSLWNLPHHSNQNHLW